MIYFVGVELHNGYDLIVNECPSCGKKDKFYYHPELRCGVDISTVVCEACCEEIEKNDRMAEPPEILKVKRLFYRKVGDARTTFVEVEDGRIGALFRRGDEHFTDFCQLERQTFFAARNSLWRYYGLFAPLTDYPTSYITGGKKSIFDKFFV